MAEGNSYTQKDYRLHRAAFHGDVERVKEVLLAAQAKCGGSSTDIVSVDESEVNLPDEHGEL